MKKSQMSEFIAIVIFIIVLIVALIIFRVNSQQTKAKQLEISLTNYRTTYILTTSSIFPYLTIERESLGILLGRYICYYNATMTSHTGNNIYFFKAVREKMDRIYDKDMWAIELDRQICITSYDVFATKCYMEPSVKFYTFDMLLSIPCRYKDATGMLYIKVV